MKNLYLHLIAASLFLYAGTLSAQKGLKVGGFALPQAVFLLNTDDQALPNEEYKQELLGGMAIGGLLGYSLNDRVGIRLNLIYSQQGGRYSDRRDVSNRTNFVRRLEYLKLPIMLGMNTNPNENKVSFSFYGGVQMALLTNAYMYNDNPSYILPVTDVVGDFPTPYETYQAFHYSVVGDIGADIKLSPRNFVLNIRLRGDYGLIDAEDKSVNIIRRTNGNTYEQKYWESAEFGRGLDANAETFNFTLGLLFGLTYSFGE